VTLSFELFPPKTQKGEISLYQNVEKLMAFEPAFITCTYGAGGSTQSKTLEIVSEVKKRFNVPVASHLTVVGRTVEELQQYLTDAQSQNVEFIVALRGDPPAGETEFKKTAGGLSYANELVELINAEFNNFDVIVAGYPEKHREAPSLKIDLENLKRKVDAGADAIVTQLFYDNDDFFRFRDACVARGIDIPIIPGMLPVTSLQQIQRIASLCGAKLPTPFIARLGENDAAQWQFDIGVEQAIEQTQGLISGGVVGLHFYVLNRADATGKILSQLALDSPAVD
jgi:methylenetetrahydrofolate reductase (NADPH)